MVRRRRGRYAGEQETGDGEVVLAESAPMFWWWGLERARRPEEVLRGNQTIGTLGGATAGGAGGCAWLMRERGDGQGRAVLGFEEGRRRCLSSA